MSGVNITPFTDVVLVLLIVFMVSAPGILTSVLHIQLPGAEGDTGKDDASLVIGLDREGEIYIDGRTVPSEEFIESLKEKMNRDDVSKVILNADTRTKHGDVVNILDKIRKAGVQAVSVGTSHK